jgi:spore maturation protein CgeB
VKLFDNWQQARSKALADLSDADVAMVGSYFPDGQQAIDDVLGSGVPIKTFYDIDTPITISQLRERGATDYLRADQVAGFDVYFSFTGGPMLREIETRFGAQRAEPLYCSFDPDEYRKFGVNKRFACDLSYMGTYAPDRQPKIDDFLCEPARRLPQMKFIVAGPQYPKTITWPANVRRIMHLNPHWHARFYSSSRFTLNVTRRDMVRAGFSPSVRLFEAAACGATIISDNWPGLDEFFTPGKEILLPVSSDDVVRLLRDSLPAELASVGQRAQERVLAEHTSGKRAEQFERCIGSAASLQSTAANSARSA